MKNTIKRWMLRQAWTCVFVVSFIFWMSVFIATTKNSVTAMILIYAGIYMVIAMFSMRFFYWYIAKFVNYENSDHLEFLAVIRGLLWPISYLGVLLFFMYQGFVICAKGGWEK